MLNKCKSLIRNSCLWKIKAFRKMSHFIFEILEKNKTKEKKNAYLSYGEKTLFDIQSIFSGTSFVVFPVYGTLLGLIREKKLLNHDLDLDFGMIKNKEFSWQKFDTIMKENGYFKKKHFEHNGKINEITYFSRFDKRLTIDFFCFYKEKNNYISYSYSFNDNEKYKIENERSVYKETLPIFNELIPINAYDKIIYVPCNYKQLLSSCYSENWIIPDKKWNNEKRPNYKLIKNTKGFEKNY